MKPSHVSTSRGEQRNTFSTRLKPTAQDFCSRFDLISSESFEQSTRLYRSRATDSLPTRKPGHQSYNSSNGPVVESGCLEPTSSSISSKTITCTNNSVRRNVSPIDSPQSTPFSNVWTRAIVSLTTPSFTPSGNTLKRFRNGESASSTTRADNQRDSPRMDTIFDPPPIAPPWPGTDYTHWVLSSAASPFLMFIKEPECNEASLAGSFRWFDRFRGRVLHLGVPFDDDSNYPALGRGPFGRPMPADSVFCTHVSEGTTEDPPSWLYPTATEEPHLIGEVFLDDHGLSKTANHPSLLVPSETTATTKDGVLSHFLCGTHLGDGSHWIGSTNMNSVPECPLQFAHVPVQRRNDGRLGPHSVSVWPQVYSRSQQHLMCIPKRPTLQSIPKHQEVLWHKCTVDDWQASTLDASRGMFTESLKSSLKDAMLHAKTSLEPIAAELTREQKTVALALPDNLITAVQRNINRLDNHHDTYQDAVNTFGQTTELLLETMGFVFHAKVFKKVARGVKDPDQGYPYHVLGAFVFSIEDADLLTRCKIPCYWVRPYSDIILDKTYVLRVEDCVKMRKVMSMDVWIEAAPVKLNAVVTPISKPSTTSTVSNKGDRKRKRLGYKAVSTAEGACLDANESPNSTTHAHPRPYPAFLKAVDSVKNDRIAVVDPPPSLYMLPPPHLLYTSGYRSRYMTNFVRARNFLYDRLRTWPFRLPLLRAECWRTALLGAIPKDATHGDTQLFDYSEVPAHIKKNELRSLVENSFYLHVYKGVPWSSLTSPDKLSEREQQRLLWELHEIGFRLDFLNLHFAEVYGASRLPDDLASSATEDCLRALGSSDEEDASHSEELCHANGASSIVGVAHVDGQNGFCTTFSGRYRQRKLRHFLRLLCQWPNVPAALKLGDTIADDDHGTMIRMERIALSFICRVFYERFHRDPVLPALWIVDEN